VKINLQLIGVPVDDVHPQLAGADCEPALVAQAPYRPLRAYRGQARVGDVDVVQGLAHPDPGCDYGVYLGHLLGRLPRRLPGDAHPEPGHLLGPLAVVDPLGVAAERLLPAPVAHQPPLQVRALRPRRLLPERGVPPQLAGDRGHAESYGAGGPGDGHPCGEAPLDHRPLVEADPARPAHGIVMFSHDFPSCRLGRGPAGEGLEMIMPLTKKKIPSH
jgi:hypothetical protein